MNLIESLILLSNIVSNCIWASAHSVFLKVQVHVLSEPNMGVYFRNYALDGQYIVKHQNNHSLNNLQVKETGFSSKSNSKNETQNISGPNI